MWNFAWWSYSLNFTYSYHFMTLIVFQGRSGVSFNWTFYDLIRLGWNFVFLLITSSRSWIYHYLWFLRMFKADKRHISSFEKHFNVPRPLLKRIFQTLHYYNLAWNLRVYCKSDDVNLLSTSHMCKKIKVQIGLLRSSFTVVWMLYGCYTHSEDHAHYKLCDSVVCSREIIYMFLVSQASGLVENFNTEIFSDTINIINVKLCIMVLHNELCLIIALSMAMTLFHSHRSVKQF